jgi:arsenate reductase
MISLKASMNPVIPERLVMNPKVRVLFICRHNSGRSQIAEAYLKRLGKDRFEVESAGLEPAETVNPLVVEVMKEEGIDLSAKKPQSAFALYKAGRSYDHVITVCEPERDTLCPVYPGIVHRLNWPFADPAAATGTHEEKLAEVRRIRDQIKQRLTDADRAGGAFGRALPGRRDG